ncbi:MAG: capsular polysaccharide biosynthesis protein [Paracoccaceae bacterium]
MPKKTPKSAAAGTNPRRLFVFNGGFLTQVRVRRILELSGWNIQLGKPDADDWVGVWGKSPTSPRGQAVADHTDATLLHVEDSFLRSLHPGRTKQPPIGLNLDQTGLHFDSSKPSDLETLLTTHRLDDTALLNRARNASDRLRRAHLSKYNAFHPDVKLPAAPYVLVIDQTRGDASIEHGGANAATFAEMLVFAQTEHPGNRIIIKGHPETAAGYRDGHFGPENENDRITYLADPVSPWALLEGAIAVYTVSSQLGFEAIQAGHRPRVFGQPFYAGWGLTADEYPVARRERKLTRHQLFAAAMILYPTWYDPYHDRLCDLESAIDAMQADARSWREDHAGYVACGMRRWKHRHLNQFFGHTTPITYAKSASESVHKAHKTGQKLMVWARFATTVPDTNGADLIRIEDGFLRSRGLGARLVPPLSLVADDLGIYYDPNQESRLERLIAAAPTLPDYEIHRAERLIARLNKSGLSKYNLPAKPLPDLPKGYKILVPGQVEDDASVLQGCGELRSNLALLAQTRAQNPNAIIIYKPHPDVVAGLRKGALDPADVQQHADLLLGCADPIALIDAVDAVWTLTSTLGFEALIRGKSVTCLGQPFYSGWGLTDDHLQVQIRRKAKPSLPALVHACLIGYPRYLDPVTSLPCSVEIALDRLESDAGPTRSKWHSTLAKLQSFFPLWRR